MGLECEHNSSLQNQVTTWVLEWPNRPGHCVWVAIESSHSNSRSKYEKWVDVERLSVFKMPKPVNCCVPGCLNNFRNSSGLHYYRIPKHRDLRKEYRIYSNKRRPRISDASTTKESICAAAPTPMRRLFEELRITRKNTILKLTERFKLFHNDQAVRSHPW